MNVKLFKTPDWGFLLCLASTPFLFILAVLSILTLTIFNGYDLIEKWIKFCANISIKNGY